MWTLALSLAQSPTSDSCWDKGGLGLLAQGHLCFAGLALRMKTSVCVDQVETGEEA